MADADILTPEDDAKIQAYMKANNINPQVKSSNDDVLTTDDDAKIQAYLAKQSKPTSFTQGLMSQLVPIVKPGANGPVTVQPATIHPIDDIRDIAQGTVQGAVNTGALLNQGMTSGVNALFGTKLKAPDVSNVAEPIGSGKDTLQAGISRGLGEYIAPGGAVKKLHNATSVLGKIVSNLSAGGLSGAANADSNQSNFFGLLPKGKTGASIEAAIANILAPSIYRPLEAARPSIALRGTLSPEELQQNLEAAAGTKTNLGDVVQNASLMKKYKNQIAPSAFSGATGDMQSVYDEIQNRGKDIVKSEIGTTSPYDLEKSVKSTGDDALKSALGVDDLADYEKKVNITGNQMLSSLFGNHDKNTIDESIHNDLNTNFKNIKQQKNLNYLLRNNHADANPDFSMDTSEFSNQAKKDIGQVKDTVFLKNNPEMKSLISKLSNYTEPVETTVNKSKILDESGKPIVTEETKKPTLGEASLLRGQLNRISKSLGQSINPDDHYLSSKFGKLAESLNKDIDNSIESSGDDELKSLHDNANKFYKEKYAPFLDKDIFPYVSGKKGSDGIANDLTDIANPTKLQRNKSLLTDKSSLAHSYFMKSFDSNGIANHEKLSSMIDSAQKLPSYNTLVDSPISQTVLSNYKDLSNKANFSKKFLSNDGSVDYDKLHKSIESNQKNPDLYQKLIPDDKGKNALNNFSQYYKKSNFYKPVLQGNGNVNIAQLNNLTKKILTNPDENKNMMTTPGSLKKAVDLQRLTQMNPSSDAPMFNPPTGKRGLDAMMSSMGAALGASIGHVPGAILGAAAPGAVLRPIAKGLTSEKIRNNVVQEMIKNRKKFGTDKQKITAQALSQALINQKGAQQ